MKIKAEKTRAIKFFLTGLLLTLLFISASIFIYGPTNTAHASINDEINFQGKLTNTNGTNVTDGTYSVVFTIYAGGTSSGGGTSEWTETDSVTTASGIFNVDLGAVTTLPGSVNFDSTPLYLGIKVGSDSEMRPLIQFTSVPQAFQANNADNLGGVAASSYAQLGATQTFTGTNTFKPTTNITSADILQNSSGSFGQDVFDVQGSSGTGNNFIQVTSTAANQGAVTIASLGSNNLSLNSGSNTISVGATTLLGTGGLAVQAASGSNISLGSNAVAGTIAIGGTGTTGTITLGQWTGTTGTQTISIGSSVGAGGTQDINIGNSGAGTSTINIGSTHAGTTTIQSAGGLAVNTIPTGGTNLLCYNSTGNIVSTCSALTGGAFINNNTTVQAANFYVQAATSGTVAGVLEAYNGGSGDILDLKNGTGVTVGSVGSTGNVLLQASTNSTTAFQIQGSAGATSTVLTADTTNLRLGVDVTYAAMSVPAPTAAVPTQSATPTVTPTGTTGATTYKYEIIATGITAAPFGSSAASVAGTTSTGNATLSNVNYNALSWTAYSNATGYYVYRSTGGGTQGYIGYTTTNSFNDTGLAATGSVPTVGGGLTASSKYYYKVTAIDSTGGETTPGTEVNATTGAANTTDSITLYWTNVPGAIGYKIYRTAAGGASNSETYLTSVTASLSGTTMSYTDSGTIATSTAYTVPVTNTAVTATNVTNTNNLELTVGGNGTPTGQLYVSGTVPTAAVGTATAGTNPGSVFVSGNYAYVANYGSNTLQIFDVSNPGSPVSLSTIATGTGPYSVYVSGHYAYVVNYNGPSMQIFDVSNPASPVVVGTIATGSDPSSVYVSGRYAYVVNYGNSTLQIFDVSNPANPVSVGSVFTNAGPTSLYVQGRYAYVAVHDSNILQIFDVSNPANPVSVGSVVTGTHPYDIYTQGRYAYIVNSASNTLQIFDVSNPASPVLVGSLTTGSGPESVYVQGRYAYVANYTSSTLQTIDVSNPANPVSVGSVSTGSSTNAKSVYVSGRYAYVVTNSNLLEAFDLGGAYVQQLQVGGAEVGTLQVDSNESIAGNSSIQGGLNVGAGLQVAGQVGVNGSLNLTANALSSPSAPTLANSTSTATICGGNYLTNTTTYYYEIAAISGNSITNAVASSPTSVTTGTSTCDTLTWTAVTGATGYIVYRSTNNQTWDSNNVNNSTLGIVDNGTTYTWTTAASPLTNTNNGGNLIVGGSIQGVSTTGTNTAGSNLNISGGQGTGTGVGGNIVFQVAKAGTTGSSVNSLSTVESLSGTNGSATFENSTNSTTGFQVQNASGANILTVDTSTSLNLIPNGDFSGDGTTGWSAISGAVLTQTATQAWQGNDSLSVATTTTAGDGTKYSGYTLLASTTYTLSLYAKVASGSITDVNIGRQDNSGTGEVACLTAQTVTTSWTRYSCTFTTAATINTNFVYISKTSTTAETFYIDGIQLQTGNTASAFNAGGGIQFNGVVESPAAFQNESNSTTAFQVQNAAGNNVLNIDTTNTHLTAGDSTITTETGEWDTHGTIATTTQTLSDSPHTVGNLMMLGDEDLGANNIVSVSGGGVTNWTKVVTAAANNQSIWEGTVTTTGAGTITVTYAAAPAAYCEIVAQEFTAGLGSNTNWSITASGSQSNASSNTVAYPTLTAAQSGELYWGYAAVTNTGSFPTPTPGFSYTLLTSTDVLAYDMDTQSGTAYSPTAYEASAGTSGTIAAVVSASVGTTLTVNGTTTLTGATSITAFQLQAANGAALLTGDTSNMRVSIGSIGTATGQLYVGGQISSAALQTMTTGVDGPQTIISSGHYVYVANFSPTPGSFSIYDNSNPAAPTLIKTQSENGSGRPQAMAMSGHYLYIVDYNASAHLNIWDVSNPDAPTLTGTIQTTNANNTGIAIDGDYAYIAENGGVDVVNISNPANPINSTFISSFGTSFNSIISVTAYGRYVYAAADGDGGSNDSFVKVIDTTTQTVVGSYELSGGTTGSFGMKCNSGTFGPEEIAVQGKWAMAENCNNSKIDIFDVSNPANGNTATTAPTYSVSTTAGYGAYSLVAQGRYLYATVADNTGGTPATLNTYDISQLGTSAPTLVGSVSTGSTGVSLAVDGRYAYVANYGANQWETFDLGGEYVQQLEAGGIDTNSLTVDNDATIDGNTSIAGSATVGQNLQVDKQASIGSTGNISPSSVNYWTGSGTNDGSLAITTSNIGDLVTVGVVVDADGYSYFPTALSGGGVTDWHQVDNQENGTNSYSIWEGIVTSTGASNITVTYDQPSGATTEIDAQEFTAGLGTNTHWAATSYNELNEISAPSTALTWPSVTASQNNELYWGLELTSSIGTAGSTSGFTYETTSQHDLVAYDPTTTAGTAYAPTATQASSGAYGGISMMISASPGTLSVNGTTSLNGDLQIQASANSTTALQIQDASGLTTLSYDTGSGNLTLADGGLYINGLSQPATSTLSDSNSSGSLTNGTTYYYLVSSASGFGESQATVPTPADEVIPGSGTYHDTLTWATVPGALYYGVYRSTNDSTWYEVQIMANNSTYCSATSCTISDSGTSFGWGQIAYPNIENNYTSGIGLQEDSGIYWNDNTGGYGNSIQTFQEGAQLQIDGANSVYLQTPTLGWQDAADGYHTGLSLDGGAGDGDAYFSNSVNNISAFEILQSNASTAVLNADTENMRISIDTNYSALSAPSGVSVLTTGSGAGNSLGTHTYYYKITALDGSGGETPFSSEVSHPFASGTTNYVTLQWTSVCGATAYRVYRGTASGGETGYYQTIGVSTNTADFTCGSATLGLLTYKDTGSTQANTTATTPSSTAAYIAYNNSNNDDQLSVGGQGLPSGQLYVSGTIPTAPIGSIATATGANQMVVEGNYAYIAIYASSGTPTLQIYNISSPDAPYLEGSATISIDNTGLAVSGHYAYVTNNSTDAIQVFDVSDPNAPTLLNSVTTGGNSTWQVMAQGGFLYVSNAGTTSNGVEIYSLANPTLPVLLNLIAAPAYINDIGVANNYLYAFGNSEVYVYNISNPAVPVSDGTFTSTEMDNEFGYVYGGYLYSDNYGDGTMQIYDISNPAAPTLLSTLATYADDNLASFSGNYMYLANGSTDDIQVIDITNPSTPIILGTIPTNGIAYDDPIQGRDLYSINSNSQMQIFDLGGTFTQSLQAGSTQVTSLSVGDDSTFIGNVNIQGATTIGQSLNVNGNLNIGGSVAGRVINDTETATATHVYNTAGTETVPAYGYNFYTDLSSNTITSQTFDITGLANVAGTTAYIELEQTTVGAASVTSIVEINGTSELQMVSTATGTYYDDAILMYNGTSWRILGQGPHSTTQPTYTNTADYAEWIDYSGGSQPQPGDVLTVGTDPDSVTDSSTPYDPELLGVVSTAPYDVAGTNDGHSVIIALSGRVPVTVNLQNGPIEPGDPLTSSSIPGQAMKATGPGDIIGTALEGYDGTESSNQIDVQLHVGYDDPTAAQGILQGDQTVQGNLTIDGDASISGNLAVDGSVEANNLTVRGTTTLNSLNVTGSTTVASLTIQGDVTFNGHIITAGNTPTVAAGQTAGTGAIVTLTGNDDSGTITIVTGTGSATGDLADITFAKVYAVAPHVSFTPGNGSAASLQYYRSVTTTGFSLNANSANGQPADNTTYIFDYQIEQ